MENLDETSRGKPRGGSHAGVDSCEGKLAIATAHQQVASRLPSGPTMR